MIWTGNNVLNTLMQYMDCSKRTLMGMAFECDGQISMSKFRTWTRKELLRFVVEHYPDWEGERA